ncbi:DNA repair exonuclease [Candidatus Woesearchaeota archaeon]|nr:DNA repair exonuclease [Candidatus Woesearchaeota archaeon]
MKFAHLADCHIGSWQRTSKLSDASINAFCHAIDICIKEKTDFILISGDLFDTSIPAIDKLKSAVSKLKEAKESGIPVYVIAGSHDFSPTGKTMLDVLEEAGLFKSVKKNSFTLDIRTGAKIAGILGKKGGLEKSEYTEMQKEELEKEDGFKIFMFHSGIKEYMPEQQIDAISITRFPKKFSYYAGGHIHSAFKKHEEGYGLIAYPGPLFPNNFEELEKTGNGGFYIVETGTELKASYKPIVLHNFESINMNCTGKTPPQIENELIEKTKGREYINTILTIRLSGLIKSGKTTDINMKSVFDSFYTKGCHCILKNTSALSSEFFNDSKQEELGTVDEIEQSLISKHGKTGTVENETEKIIGLVKSLSMEKEEGERLADFERRIIDEAEAVLGISIKPTHRA